MRKDHASRSAELRRLFRRLALELNPNGEFQALADELLVTPGTLGNWIKHGRVPGFQARRINARFGNQLAPLSTLLPEDR